MFFYSQSQYIGDGCVAYNYMELKHYDDVEKRFFIYSKYCNKGLIELNVTFGHSSEEILAQLRKPKTNHEIIALMRDEMVYSLRKVLVVTFLE